MLINYLRSSSYSNYDFCQMQYFINYVLGVPNPAGKAADKGSCVHKVLETLANCKKYMQDYPNLNEYTYDIFTWKAEDFLKPVILSKDEIFAINKTRINKYNYKNGCQLKDNHIRYGTTLVNSIIENSLDKFATTGWTNADRMDCTNWVWMALEYYNGIFDCRRMNIVQAEQHFELIFDEKFEIKGTIDLITSPKEGILEVIDLKSGSRVDWSSKNPQKNPKTYTKLCRDIQLMMYYYAVRQLYPEAHQVLVTIFWIRDGGPYTICFDNETVSELRQKLCTRFQSIRNCTKPQMQDSSQSNFKCTKLCNYYKLVSPDGEKNLCRFINDEIASIGIDKVTDLYTESKFSIDKYEAPG